MEHIERYSLKRYSEVKSYDNLQTPCECTLNHHEPVPERLEGVFPDADGEWVKAKDVESLIFELIGMNQQLSQVTQKYLNRIVPVDDKFPMLDGED